MTRPEAHIAGYYMSHDMRVSHWWGWWGSDPSPSKWMSLDKSGCQMDTLPCSSRRWSLWQRSWRFWWDFKQIKTTFLFLIIFSIALSAMLYHSAPGKSSVLIGSESSLFLPSDLVPLSEKNVFISIQWRMIVVKVTYAILTLFRWIWEYCTQHEIWQPCWRKWRMVPKSLSSPQHSGCCNCQNPWDFCMSASNPSRRSTCQTVK